MEKVLNLGGFDLDCALEVDPKFMKPEYPFEWSGLFDLKAGDYKLILTPGPDPAMSLNFRSAAIASKDAMRDSVEKAVLVFSDDEVELQVGATIYAGEQLSQINLEGDNLEYTLHVLAAGAYVLFTEHHLDEFEAYVTDAEGARVEALCNREYKPDHEHDEEVTPVGINTSGDLDLKKFQGWLNELLATQGADIFRMKGVLSFADTDERYVFRGLHMLFDGRIDRPWREGERGHSLS